MDDHGDADVAGGYPAEHPCLARMGMDYVGLEPGELGSQLLQAPPVGQWVELASQLWYEAGTVWSCVGLWPERSFRPGLGACEEGHVVAFAGQTFACQQGVFLGATYDQACDDMADPHLVSTCRAGLRGPFQGLADTDGSGCVAAWRPNPLAGPGDQRNL